MRSAICAVLLSGNAIVAGCGVGTDEQTQPLISEVDGIRQVHLPSRNLDAPRWGLREIYNTSGSETGIELFRVVGARFLNDGTLAIANSGSREILRLDPHGAMLGRFGRAGSGPGEFSMMTRLDVDRSDNLIVYDPRHVRLTRLKSTGEVLNTKRLASEDAVIDLLPLSELEDGRILAVFGSVRIFGRSGESRDTVPLIVVDPSGARSDTLGTWAANEWASFEFPGGVTRAEVGFGRSMAYSGRGGRVALGSTDSLNVAVFDDAGHLVMRIVGWGASAEVSGPDVERWRTELLDQRPQASAEIRRWLSTAPYRATYPALRDLLVDDRGRIWIGMFPRVGESQDWLVVGVDGSLQGKFTVPSGSRLLDAAGDQVAILRRTSLDEEYVVVMAIERER